MIFICAKCEQPMTSEEPGSMAATSTNFVMLLHRRCMERMHELAVELTDDVRRLVIDSVINAYVDESEPSDAEL